jgi:DNA end-binding protein Ku
MVEAGLVAIAQVVIAGREQLVMLRPQDGMLVMSVLSYPKKVRAATPYREELPNENPSAGELALAHTLIGASTLADFDFQRYRDAYVESLTKLIQLKVEGREIVQAPDPEEPKILNLMEALKKSVAELGVRKMAPSVTPEGGAAAAEATPPRKKRSRKTG